MSAARPRAGDSRFISLSLTAETCSSSDFRASVARAPRSLVAQSVFIGAPFSMRSLLHVLKFGGTDDEGVRARRNQGQRHGSAASIAAVILRLQPKAEPGIGNFRLAVPEMRSQPAFDAQVIELQFNFCNV